MHNMQGQGGGGGGTVQGVQGVSADRVENVSALSKKELENLLKHGMHVMSQHIKCYSLPPPSYFLFYLTHTDKDRSLHLDNK